MDTSFKLTKWLNYYRSQNSSFFGGDIRLFQHTRYLKSYTYHSEAAHTICSHHPYQKHFIPMEIPLLNHTSTNIHNHTQFQQPSHCIVSQMYPLETAMPHS